MDKTKLSIAVLAVLLAIAIGYIGWDKFQEEKALEVMQAYRQGYNQGIRDTVVSLLQQTENCNPTTINLGNFTRRVVDTACRGPSPP